MRLASTRTLRREIDEAVIAGKPIGEPDCGAGIQTAPTSLPVALS